ncbi:MAG TPA: FoF1 ATP synthase subunit a [Mycobacteriales bacterium]|nr:FoF1 ATP synthase subunit a [Mycobacteriales bacterium]
MNALQVQADIAFATLLVAAVVLLLGLVGQRRPTAGVPNGVRLLWEMSIGAADRAAGALPTGVRNRVIGTTVTLFWFVAVANWLHLIPGSALPAPTSDINLALALAAVAMGSVHITALQVRGVRGYARYYLSPWWLAPFKLLEELIKPLTLALRLFGMVFASALMVVLIGEILPAPAAVLPHVLWTLFDVFIGAIQAFIFALLTLLYFQAVLPSAERG